MKRIALEEALSIPGVDTKVATMLSSPRCGPHIAFGVGPHVSLGASLARMEVRAVSGELAKRLRSVGRAGGPQLVASLAAGGQRRPSIRYTVD